MQTTFFLIAVCLLIQSATAQNIITISNSRTVILPKDYMEGVPEYFVPEGVTITLSSDSNYGLIYYLNKKQFYNNTNVLQITNLSQWNNDIIAQFNADYIGNLNVYLNYPTLVAGPIYLKVLPSGQNFTNSYYKNHFTINYKTEASATGQTNASIVNPNSSVVIPSNVSGDVEVVLEQSQDGVTWTQCLPGTYNASTVKRFFRLRAVEK